MLEVVEVVLAVVDGVEVVVLVVDAGVVEVLDDLESVR